MAKLEVVLNEGRGGHFPVARLIGTRTRGLCPYSAIPNVVYRLLDASYAWLGAGLGVRSGIWYQYRMARSQRPYKPSPRRTDNYISPPGMGMHAFLYGRIAL